MDEYKWFSSITCTALFRLLIYLWFDLLLFDLILQQDNDPKCFARTTVTSCWDSMSHEILHKLVEPMPVQMVSVIKAKKMGTWNTEDFEPKYSEIHGHFSWTRLNVLLRTLCRFNYFKWNKMCYILKQIKLFCLVITDLLTVLQMH